MRWSGTVCVMWTDSAETCRNLRTFAFWIFLQKLLGWKLIGVLNLLFGLLRFAHFSLVQISFPTSLTHTTDATRPSYKYRQMDPTFLSFFLPTHHHSPYSDIFPSRTPTLVKLLTS
ncbi:hypothetical protein K443DRAFT_255874 [Laccaria amethystina LaAM-08-1]|uniref:Uncharacterized protein n=1 Tax=Laccaria amethystina LaAM-08-1 TaxID=1095629 RepID=A0A0C9XHW8_9AGAR|nr:hypothetical protein K443DRAFT_255874 [Laccaria amethystina LaAM-08-1]